MIGSAYAREARISTLFSPYHHHCLSFLCIVHLPAQQLDASGRTAGIMSSTDAAQVATRDVTKAEELLKGMLGVVYAALPVTSVSKV